MDLVTDEPSTTCLPEADLTRPHPSRRERRRDRRRLVRQDRTSARLAELHTVSEVLTRAEVLVAAGWLQGAWFSYPAPGGPRVSHLPGGLSAAAAASANRFCLVAAVHAAASAGAGTRLTHAERPLADRAVDTVWRTLVDAERGAGLPHLPPPAVGGLRRLDLTRWNDDPGRRASQVRDLLCRAAATARADLSGARLLAGVL